MDYLPPGGHIVANVGPTYWVDDGRDMYICDFLYSEDLDSPKVEIRKIDDHDRAQVFRELQELNDES